MCYAALDVDLRLLALDKGDMEAVLALVGSFEQAVIGINAPQAPNKGLLRQEPVRRVYDLQPGGPTWKKWRVCEFELRRRNIRLHNTPSTKKDAQGWVKRGFEIHKRLSAMDFRYFSDEGPQPRMLIEVQPHASFTALLDHRPFLKRDLEGRMQRQLVLFLEGLDVPNPMLAVEEISRHRLLTGNLPFDALYGPDQLDTLMAAFVAFLVGVKPERVCQVGDVDEGLITLPVAKLRDFYP
jgi:hypothetical protein